MFSGHALQVEEEEEEKDSIQTNPGKSRFLFFCQILIIYYSLFVKMAKLHMKKNPNKKNQSKMKNIYIQIKPEKFAKIIMHANMEKEIK